VRANLRIAAQIMPGLKHLTRSLSAGKPVILTQTAAPYRPAEPLAGEALQNPLVAGSNNIPHVLAMPVAEAKRPQSA
jgi:hypothetical protein